jgi:hypothetical protein
MIWRSGGCYRQGRQTKPQHNSIGAQSAATRGATTHNMLGHMNFPRTDGKVWAMKRAEIILGSCLVIIDILQVNIAI